MIPSISGADNPVCSGSFFPSPEYPLGKGSGRYGQEKYEQAGKDNSGGNWNWGWHQRNFLLGNRCNSSGNDRLREDFAIFAKLRYSDTADGILNNRVSSIGYANKEQTDDYMSGYSPVLLSRASLYYRIVL